MAIDQIMESLTGDDVPQVLNQVGEIVTGVKSILESWSPATTPQIYVPQTTPAAAMQPVSQEPFKWDTTTIVLAGGLAGLLLLAFLRH